MITVLKEKFSSNLPKWITDAVGHKSLGWGKSAAGRNRDMHIAWDTATYHKSSLPQSARTAEYKEFKEKSKMRVGCYRLHYPDTKYNSETKGFDKIDKQVVYIPGICDPDIPLSLFEYGKSSWQTIPASHLAYKNLLSITLEYGYIDASLDGTTNKRMDRAQAKAGSIDRDIKAGAHMARDYYDKLKWTGPSRGYDKSGYKLDPYKYINMLAKMDAGDTKSAARRIESLYNQIEAVRQAVVNELSKTSKEINASGKDKYHSRLEQLSNAVRYVSGAMEEYERLLGTLDEINKEKGKKMSDKEREAMKDWYSRDLVRVSKDCKDYIKYAKEYLNGTRD